METNSDLKVNLTKSWSSVNAFLKIEFVCLTINYLIKSA